MTDYVETYNDFWREIVENPDGTLNRDQVMRELYDYRVVMEEVSKAYGEVTGGLLSKPNTAAHHIVAAVEERIEAVIRAVREQVAEELRADADAHRRVVERKPSEYDKVRLARARTLEDAASRITRWNAS
ncbi:hypothetical protein [Actinomadura sediminis]|uniref:Uncharacterized protein n=1 Tax=Actinomadura sediminis TaxID=1038904 RepID=A0ABW3EPV0_9ACTN